VSYAAFKTSWSLRFTVLVFGERVTLYVSEILMIASPQVEQEKGDMIALRAPNRILLRGGHEGHPLLYPDDPHLSESPPLRD
jgi:hypothetical protein